MRWIKPRAALCLFAAASLCAGCTGGLKDLAAENTQVEAIQEEGAEHMDQIELTQQEISLLGAVYPNQERIENGELFDYQEEALYQLRAGKAYLEQKYPGISFEITSFMPANQFTQWAELTFCDEKGDREYRLTVTPEGESYTCADDYYGAVLREPYDQEIVQTLAAGGFTVLSYTQFPAPAGMEIGADTSVDDIIAMGSRLTRNTHLFSDQPCTQERADQMKELLSQAGFYGSFTLYQVPSLEEEVLRLEEGRRAFPYISFQCF